MRVPDSGLKPRVGQVRYRKGWITDHESDYYTLLEHQGYGCGICGNQTRSLVVDHDHATKQIRGLLCQSCNLWLGHTLDKYAHEYLISALSYLVHPPAGWLD